MLLTLLGPLARASIAPATRALDAALRDPEGAQQLARERVWAAIRDTAYGARHTRFDALPLATWDDVAPWMARQQAGEPDVVTRERVLFWEPTSGSSSGTPKAIPYTAGLRASFSRMFAAWAHDLLAHGPPLRLGTGWFSVTPRFHALPPGGDGAPVGTRDDRDYLDGPLRALGGLVVQAFLAVALEHQEGEGDCQPQGSRESGRKDKARFRRGLRHSI